MPLLSMSPMPLHPGWGELIVRLLLALLAGALVGLDRQRGAHAAGLRTTILITLAACLAMILANLLLAESGRTDASFSSMDVLRLPLGVLTGVGFIGAGAILRHGDGVSGVTTAATIWIMTVIGLSFGAGQIWLGSVGTGIAFLVLGPLQWFDRRLKREHLARLTLRCADGVDPFELARTITALGCEARLERLQRGNDDQDLTFLVAWRGNGSGPQQALLGQLPPRCRVIGFELA